jgi:hypothetical protein
LRSRWSRAGRGALWGVGIEETKRQRRLTSQVGDAVTVVSALVVSVSAVLVLVAAVVVCHGYHCHHGGGGRGSHIAGMAPGK